MGLGENHAERLIENKYADGVLNTLTRNAGWLHYSSLLYFLSL